MHKIRGGILVQTDDTKTLTAAALKVVTKRAPTEAEVANLLFAWAVCCSTKSNTVVAAKRETLIASGAGQQDRKRCAELCVTKGGAKIKGTVAASDGFFPFPDSLQVLTNAGVTAVIQPGGSVKDNEVIAAADEAGIAMMFTGIRAFRH
jgi:phosphoribosylaminoimidazolecarboxamide formyltransferase/IMP cyclohydrolase